MNKSVFNFILSVLALVLIVLHVLFLIPAVGFLGSEFMMGDFVQAIMNYGPIFILALFAIVNFCERSFKIIFLILTILAFIALIIGLIFPELFIF